jgi:hypothetical protein
MAWARDGASLLPSAEADRLSLLIAKTGRSNITGSGAIWRTAEERLQNNGVTPQQVQVAWIKQAEARPAQLGDFPDHARILETNLEAMLNIAKKKYPHLRVAYLSSRIFGGYATSDLNRSLMRMKRPSRCAG